MTLNRNRNSLTHAILVRAREILSDPAHQARGRPHHPRHRHIEYGAPNPMTAQVTAADLLTKARTIIADPARWTTGTYARNKTGHSVPPSNPNAVCFCTYGAVERAAVELRSDHEVMKDAFRTLQCTAHTHFPPAGPQTPAYINDELGHEAALKLLDHSIEAARP